MQTTAKRPQKLSLCTGLACSRKGGAVGMRRIKELLHIRENPVSADGSVRLETMECSGNCHLAPLMVLNRDLLLPQQIESLPQMCRVRGAKARKSASDTMQKSAEVRA